MIERISQYFTSNMQIFLVRGVEPAAFHKRHCCEASACGESEHVDRRTLIERA
jgi:hypothetical protein